MGEITRFSASILTDQRTLSADASRAFLVDRENFITVSKGIERELARQADKLRTHGFTVSVSTKKDLYRTLRAIMTKQGLALSDPTLRSWIFDDALPQRNNVIKICFALILTPDQANDFLNKTFGLDCLNPRNIEEAIFYYCLKWDKSYDDATALIARFNSAPTAQHFSDENTAYISTRLQTIEKDDDAFIEMLINLKHSFTNQRQTAIARYNELTEYMYEVYSSLNVDAEDYYADKGGYVRREDEPKLAANEEGVKKPASYDKMLELLLYYDIPVVESDLGSESIPMNPANTVLAHVLKGIPMPSQFLKYDRGEIPPNRQTMILLNFLKHFSDAFGLYEIASPYKVFYDDTNSLLNSCGMAPLYPANSFDWLILKCVLRLERSLMDGPEDAADPIAFFNDVIADAFEQPAVTANPLNIHDS